MEHFYRTIRLDDQNVTFYFNKIKAADGFRYCVSVVNGEGKTYIYYMVEQQGRWVFTHTCNCPGWLLSQEQKLSAIIAEHDYH